MDSSSEEEAEVGEEKSSCGAQAIIQTHKSVIKRSIINELLQKLYEKWVIEGEIISHVYIRPESDGSYRLILNLCPFE